MTTNSPASRIRVLVSSRQLTLAVALVILPYCRCVYPQGTETQAESATPLPLGEFTPVSKLRVEEHLLTRAKFPVIDVHVHPRIRLHSSPDALDEYVRIMDAQNIAVSVSLDGGWGDSLTEHRTYLNAKHGNRFVYFANIDWQGSGKGDDFASWDCNRPDFPRMAAEKLAQAKSQGACGLKVFKDFGLVYRDGQGKLLRIDDPRWDPIWKACGDLGLCVLIHTADPAAFFDPIDAKNERFEELSRHPEWSFHGNDYPSQNELLEAFLRVVERHSQTKFIGAHVAGCAEDLEKVGIWLDRYPNLYVEIAARIAELGRQPHTARRFLLKYQDRVLFGTDGPRAPERLYYHWRFLETEDEYFPYAENPFPPQGFWRIYGVYLPDEVLEKIYFRNALRLIPAIQPVYNSATSKP